MLQFHQMLPGGHFVTTRYLAHNGQCIATWNLCDQQGRALGEGISYARYGESGKLDSMTGFFDVAALTQAIATQISIVTAALGKVEQEEIARIAKRIAGMTSAPQQEAV